MSGVTFDQSEKLDMWFTGPVNYNCFTASNGEKYCVNGDSVTRFQPCFRDKSGGLQATLKDGILACGRDGFWSFPGVEQLGLQVSGRAPETIFEEAFAKPKQAGLKVYMYLPPAPAGITEPVHQGKGIFQTTLNPRTGTTTVNTHSMNIRHFSMKRVKECIEAHFSRDRMSEAELMRWMTDQYDNSTPTVIKCTENGVPFEIVLNLLREGFSTQDFIDFVVSFGTSALNPADRPSNFETVNFGSVVLLSPRHAALILAPDPPSAKEKGLVIWNYAITYRFP